MKKSTICNHEDHEKWSRKAFLQSIGLAGAGSLAFANSSLLFAKESELSAAIQAAENDHILIIIRLFGGNDALNMIVPINQYDTYANARPNLKIATSNLWNLSDDYGMPTYMDSLEPLWGDGQMKIVHSVGYENHSQSHFKGSDIWATAETEGQENGWLGKYYEYLHPDYLTNPPETPTAIQIGGKKNLTFQGDESDYSFAVSSITRLNQIAKNGTNYGIENLPDCTHGDLVKTTRSIANSTYAYSDVIAEAYDKATDYTQGDGYGTDDFASSLALIARLIKGGLGTKVYMLTLNGFDTHASQNNDHPALLENLSKSVSYFYEDLKNAGWADKVLSMGISEFGRRVAENGSEGTDHGTSCPVLFFGDGLKGSGFVGKHASLEAGDLVNGRDLKHHTDFRNVYATVLKEWMCVDERIVDDLVLGGSYDTVSLGFECSTGSLSTAEVQDNPFQTEVFYEHKNTYIALNANNTQHVVVKLHSLSGQDLGMLMNEMLYEGNSKQIAVNAAMGYSLTQGYYIYSVSSNRTRYSKKLMIL